MNDPNKKKKPINAYLAANPNSMFSKTMLKDWKKRFGISQNKVVQIASQMMTKPDNRI